MSKVNRPDTLHTELRELRRRIRLLESSRSHVMTPAIAARPTVEWAPTVLPVRSQDWWSVAAEQWERIAVCRMPGRMPESTLVLSVADGAGAVRVAIDGAVWTEVPVAPAPDGRETVQIPIPVAEPGPEADRELSLEARGTFRMLATIQV